MKLKYKLELGTPNYNLNLELLEEVSRQPNHYKRDIKVLLKRKHRNHSNVQLDKG